MQICGGVTYKVTYPSRDLSQQSLAAETFCVLEDYRIPSPFSPISQEELDELSIQSDDSIQEPTSPLGTALSRRKHSKTRVEDAEANYWNQPMSQEELDGYTMGCEWKERLPSSPEASRLHIRKNMMFSKKMNICDPLQTIAFDGGASGNYVAAEADDFQGGESPMSKALRKKKMSASLGEEAQKDEGGKEEGWKSCSIAESEILRRKKHMAVQKTSLSFFGEGQLFAMADETEAQDGSESPMSKALRRKEMLKNEQENRRADASLDFRSGKSERQEGGDTGVLTECAPPPLSPINPEQPSTSLLRRKKQNQLAGGLRETNFFAHIENFTGSSGSPTSPSPMTQAINSRPHKFKKIEPITTLDLPSVPDSVGLK